MSRHRNVRSMNYSDEYDGYDDVYGHSVEDDYCVSPSAEQFLFDRNKQHNISSYITEDDIVEEDETQEETPLPPSYKRPELSVLDATKLESCIEAIKNVVGDSIPESTLTENILKHNLNSEAALDAILATTSSNNASEKPAINQNNEDLLQDRQASTFGTLSSLVASFPSGPVIPKLQFKKKMNNCSSLDQSLDDEVSVDSTRLIENDFEPKAGFSFSKQIVDHIETTASPSDTNIQTFGSLADLTAHHLRKSSSSGGISSPVIGSPNTGFVIPKLRTISNSSGTPPTISFKQPSEYSFPRQIIDPDDASSCISSETDSKIDTHVPVQASFECTRTPSPDNWVIDLSSALSEIFPHVEPLNDESHSKSTDDLSHGISRLDIYLNTHTPDAIEAGPSKVFFDCNLSLSNLQHIKLPYRTRMVSLFGKILCKRWKLRKPYIKNEGSVEVIKRFDFSIPSPDDRILVHLRKRF